VQGASSKGALVLDFTSFQRKPACARAAELSIRLELQCALAAMALRAQLGDPARDVGAM
jgi:hypothetical protein